MPLPLRMLCGPSSTLRDDLVRQLVSCRAGLVAVLHDTDELITRSVVRRRVLDSAGTLEDTEVELAHGCVSCTIREDVLPTLVDVADDGRWSEVLLALPVPVLPLSVSQVLAQASADSPALAEAVRLDGVTALVDAVLLREHLDSNDLLSERGLAAADTDRRSMAELVCAQLEQADVLAVAHLERAPTGQARTVDALLTHLAPLAVRVPLAPDGTGCEQLVSTGRADGSDPGRWDPEQRTRLTVLSHELLGPVAGVATLVWRADRPLHPTRLHAALSDIAADLVRSTGQVELANRPGATQYWESAGRTLSLQTAGPGQDPVAGSELLLTGVGLSAGPLAALLDSCLVTGAERARTDWSGLADPFADALGPAGQLPALPGTP